MALTGESLPGAFTKKKGNIDHLAYMKAAKRATTDAEAYFTGPIASVQKILMAQ